MESLLPMQRLSLLQTPLIKQRPKQLSMPLQLLQPQLQEIPFRA